MAEKCFKIKDKFVIAAKKHTMENLILRKIHHLQYKKQFVAKLKRGNIKSICGACRPCDVRC
jgi:hypothetical protein